MIITQHMIPDKYIATYRHRASRAWYNNRPIIQYSSPTGTMKSSTS